MTADFCITNLGMLYTVLQNLSLQVETKSMAPLGHLLSNKCL